LTQGSSAPTRWTNNSDSQDGATGRCPQG
jgi:hypothetical protein